MKEGNPRKIEELIGVKDNTDIGVIVCNQTLIPSDWKLARVSYRQGVAKTNKEAQCSSVRGSISLGRGLHCLRFQEKDSQLHDFPSHPTFLYFQKGKTKV